MVGGRVTSHLEIWTSGKIKRLIKEKENSGKGVQMIWQFHC